jgi:hypothetical protein
VLLPPQVLADACLDLHGMGEEMLVEVNAGAITLSGSITTSFQTLVRLTSISFISGERAYRRVGAAEREGT